MPLSIKDLRGNVNRQRPTRDLRVVWLAVLAGAVLGVWRLWPISPNDRSATANQRPAATPLSATPSEDLVARLAELPDLESDAAENETCAGVGFNAFLVHELKTRGHLTVTLHVALADRRLSRAPKEFINGDEPAKNLYWGALFGIDTFFANAGGWERAGSPLPPDPRILSQSVFRQHVEPTPQWQSRGITEPFDVYVLANAWASRHIREALRQPLRDALSDTSITLQIGDTPVSFGSRSVITGYLGLNSLLDAYADPFEGLPLHRSEDRPQMGVFYICPRSAIVLHADVVAHDLHSVLFTRDTIVPEAYIAHGLLEALIAGDLDDGFLEGAARAYVQYQKTVSIERAREIFYR